MGLSVRGDPSHPGGGYAILTSDAGGLPDEVAIEDRMMEMFLNEVGEWTRRPVLLRVERIDAASVRLGPRIVDAISADSVIAFHEPEGMALGALVWPATIRPSAGAGGSGVLPGRDVFTTRKPDPPPSRPEPTIALRTEAPPTLDPPAPVRVPDPPRPSPPPSPPPTPAPRTGRWKTLLVVVAALAVAAALFAYGRDSDFEQNLVCATGSILHDATFGDLIAPCHREDLPPDPEEAAYTEFLRCGVGKSGCLAKDCANAFTSRFPRGRYFVEVDTIRRDAERKCSGDNQAKIFEDFKACIASKDVCNQSECVNAYRGRLTIDSYVKQLNALQADAAAKCEDERFTAFTSCIAQSAACDAADCDRKYGGPLRAGPHAADVQRLLESKKTECVPPGPTPKQAASDFLDKYYRIHTGMGATPGETFNELYADTVSYYGSSRSRDFVVGKKNEFFQQYSSPSYSIRSTNKQIDCTDNICHVSAVVDSSFRKNNTGLTVTGAVLVDFTFVDVTTNPRVSAESAKKYP